MKLVELFTQCLGDSRVPLAFMNWLDISAHSLNRLFETMYRCNIPTQDSRSRIMSVTHTFLSYHLGSAFPLQFRLRGFRIRGRVFGALFGYILVQEAIIQGARAPMYRRTAEG